jgi:hypothetical protein
VAKAVQEQGSTGDFTAVCLEFSPFFEGFPSNSLEIQRFGRVWREGNGTAKTSYELDWAV